MIRTGSWLVRVENQMAQIYRNMAFLQYDPQVRRRCHLKQIVGPWDTIVLFSPYNLMWVLSDDLGVERLSQILQK